MPEEEQLPEEAQDGDGSQPGTFKFYFKRRNMEYYPGAPFSVLQDVYRKFEEKVCSRTHRLATLPYCRHAPRVPSFSSNTSMSAS